MNTRALLGIFCLCTPFAAADQDVFLSLTRAPLPMDTLPTSVESVGPTEFARWNAQTAGEAVSRLTSIQVQPVGSLGALQTIRLRGSNTNQNLVMIDGRPIGSVAFASSQDLTEIPIEAIERIEVIRGGASSLYGPNALAGVIHIITRRGTNEKTSGSLGYDYGSYGRNIFRGSVGSKKGPFDYFLYGNKQNESGFRDNSEAATLNVGTHLGLSLGKAGGVELSGALYQADQGIPGQFFPAIPTNRFDTNRERAAVSSQANQTTQTQSLRASHEIGLPRDSKLTTSVWGSERRVIYKDRPSFVNTDRTEWSKGSEVKVNAPLGLTFGGSFLQDKEDSIDHITPRSSFTRKAENVGFFIEEKFYWKPLTVIPSGRFDRHSQFGWSKNPRVQTIVDATDNLRISCSAARSFRAPTIDELYYPFTNFGFGFSYRGNPSLQPETAWSYDGGFELYNDAVSFKATYFRTNVSNLIQSTLDNASTVINIGNARRQGAELQLDKTDGSILLNALFGILPSMGESKNKITDFIRTHSRDTVNYTYLDNRGIPPGFTDDVELRYSPRHTVNWVATFSPCSHFDWDNAVRYVDARFSGNNETGTKLGSMVLWDTKLTKRWKQLEAYLSVRDVTNRRYEEQAGYPLPGRTFLGGVAWKY